MGAALVGFAGFVSGDPKPVQAVSCASWSEAATLAEKTNARLLEMPADLVPTALRLYNDQEPKSNIAADRIALARLTDAATIQIVLISHGCIVSTAVTSVEGAKALWQAAERARA
jgi:hypothetical protein